MKKFSIYVYPEQIQFMQDLLKLCGWKIKDIRDYKPEVFVCDTETLEVCYESSTQMWWNKQQPRLNNGMSGFGQLLSFKENATAILCNVMLPVTKPKPTFFQKIKRFFA